jgi:hypothetical protein
MDFSEPGIEGKIVREHVEPLHVDLRTTQNGGGELILEHNGFHVEFTRGGGHAWKYDARNGKIDSYDFFHLSIHHSSLWPAEVSLAGGIEYGMHSKEDFRRDFKGFSVSQGYITIDFGEYTMRGQIRKYKKEVVDVDLRA